MTDISESLRQLLLARAAGQIGAEEFERRQAALHAELMATAPKAAGFPWRWAGGAAFAVAVAAAGSYLWLERPASEPSPPASVETSPMTPMTPMTAMPEGPARAGSAGDLKVMAGRLAEKLTKDPTNAEGWALLGQTYVETGQYKLADQAFAKAAALRPADAKLLADWADAHVVGSERKWDPQARDLVARALAADPKLPKALALAGSEAFERGEYKKAIDYWKKMRAVAPAGSMDAKLADANIEEANAVMTGKRPAAAAETTPTAPAATGATVGGTVSLAPALKGRAAATDTVFVFAKSVDGTGAPLAVERLTVADLPAKFSLSDSDAMVPARSLSRFGEVQVSARLSKSGDAMPQVGDVVSNVVRTKVGAGDIKLRIGQ